MANAAYGMCHAWPTLMKPTMSPTPIFYLYADISKMISSITELLILQLQDVSFVPGTGRKKFVAVSIGFQNRLVGLTVSHFVIT